MQKFLGSTNELKTCKFNYSMLKSSLCDYVTLKICVSFTNCISEISNTQVDDAKDLDVVMSMYKLIEHSDNYAKTSRSL